MPFFSIIIPTRNRHETLPYAIQTVLQQDFEDYEIIISDNSNPDNDLSQKAVASLASDKIRYFRTPKPLAMHDNWEYALEQIMGEFVIIIGDDDGLLPQALTDLHRALSASGEKLLRWQRVLYTWPDAHNQTHADRIKIPYPFRPFYEQSERLIKAIITLKTGYFSLPMLYNSVVHRSLLQLVKEKSGRIFNAIAPDLASGFALAYLVPEFLVIGKPISIAGHSVKSNGNAFMYAPKKNQINSDFDALMAQSQIRFHPQVPYIRSIEMVVMDTFLSVKERMFPTDKRYAVSRKDIIRMALDTTVIYDGTEEDAYTRQSIMKAVKDDPSLTAYTEKLLQKHTFTQGNRSDLHQANHHFGLSAATVEIRGKDMGINDVLGASQLAGKIIGNASDDYLFYGKVPLPIMSLKERVKNIAKIILRGYL